MKRSIHVWGSAFLIAWISCDTIDSFAIASITIHQYHLGEDDTGSGVGLPGAHPTLDAVGSANLGLNGAPNYGTGSLITGTTLGLNFANTYGPDANGSAADFYRDSTTDYNPSDPANWGMEAWVNFDSIPTLAVDNQQEAGIIHAGSFVGGSLILQTVEDEFGNLVFGAHAPGVTLPKGTTVIMPGTWNHVAAVVNAGTLELYVNGVLEDSGGVGGLNPAAGLTVGAVNYAGTGGLQEGRGLDGSVDEARIFEFDAGQFDPQTDLQLTDVFTELLDEAEQLLDM